MSDEIGLFEAICSQRAIRHLRPDPVPEVTIRKLIEAATNAPSGANRQPWKFIVNRFPEEYDRSLIRRKFALDTSSATVDETLGEFIKGIRAFPTPDDWQRVLGNRALQAR